VFRLAIYFLQRHEKALLKDDFPGMVMRLKEVHKEESLPSSIDDIFTETLKVVAACAWPIYYGVLDLAWPRLVV
jgi:hypothetical protein